MTRSSQTGDRRINVLIVIAGLGIGGAEVVVQRLIKAIDRRRFNPVICCLKTSGPIGEDLARGGEEIIVLSREGEQRTNYLQFLKLLKVIRSRKIDVVHTHTTDALADAAVCKLFMPRLKLVHTFHFGNYPHRASRELLLEKIFSKLASRIVAVGEVQQQQLLDTFGFKPEAVQTVWNGVQIPIEDDDPRIARFREGFGGDIVIGNICTLIEQKGLFDFIEVARNIRQVRRDVKFVIVGGGHLQGRLQEKIEEYKLTDCVFIRGWMVDAAKIALPSIDVFFQPSRWEAMSIALLEAMAAGKAVVASAVGESPHVIDDGLDGILVAPQDLDAMTAALLKLIDDRSLREQMGSAAKQKVMRRFSVAQMTNEYERIYAGT